MAKTNIELIEDTKCYAAMQQAWEDQYIKDYDFVLEIHNWIRVVMELSKYRLDAYFDDLRCIPCEKGIERVDFNFHIDGRRFQCTCMSSGRFITYYWKELEVNFTQWYFETFKILDSDEDF